MVFKNGSTSVFLCQQTTVNRQQTLSTFFMSTDNSQQTTVNRQQTLSTFFMSTDNGQQSTDFVHFFMSTDNSLCNFFYLSYEL